MGRRLLCNAAASLLRPNNTVPLYSYHVKAPKVQPDLPAPPPILMIHGVLGSESTYRSILTRSDFAPRRDRLAVDLRNHGRSPHVAAPPRMTYADMAADIVALLDELDVPSACLVGHSMGGKVAMQLALSAPDRVSELVVVDIAPVTYAARADAADPNVVLSAMSKLDLDTLSERRAIDAELERHGVTSLPVRQFVMTNLLANPEGSKAKYRWKLNAPAITASMPNIMSFPEHEGRTYSGPTCAIRGGKSPYVPFKAMRVFTALFPNTKLVTISDAGHWLQAQMPDAFCSSVNDFLND